MDASGKRKYRLVICYRKLNNITVSYKYPIPNIVIDLKSGFHQILLTESDMRNTAFSVNNGKYEFTRLLFGLKNAPSVFEGALGDILREHIGEICYVYNVDVIIFSEDVESHLKNS